MPAPDPPSPEGRASRRARLAAAITVPAVVVAGAAGFASVDLLAPLPAGGAALAYLPADGAVALVVGDDETVIEETTRGRALLDGLPPLASDAHYVRLGDRLAETALWRVTSTPVDSDAPQRVSVYATTDAGVELLATAGGASGFSYDPGLVVLPADPTPGVEWRQEGAALPNGVADYVASGRVVAADDGCVGTVLELAYSSDGVELLTGTVESTWCPGRGIVESHTAAVGPEGELSASSHAVEGEGVAARLEAPPTTLSSPSGWAGASDWGVSALAFRLSDPFFGDSDLLGATDARGAATASGVLAVSFAGDLTGYRTEQGVATRLWTAHPGGRVLWVHAVGDVLLVGTADRRVAAYTDGGVRLWDRTFPDLVLGDPAADGTGGAVIAALDGSVVRVDLLTGEPGWTASAGGEVEAAPVVVDEVVAVATRGGEVRALRLGDGSAAWAGPTEDPALLAASDGAVVAFTEAAQVIAFDAGSGDRVWSDGLIGVPVAVDASDGIVVTMADEVTAAWDLDSGDLLWVDPRGVGMTLVDGHLLAVSADDVAVLELRTGRVISAWRLPDLPDGDVVGVVPGADRFWVVSAFLEGWELAP